MGLSRTISEETAISVENQFSTPSIERPRRRIPLSLGIGAFVDKKVESLRCRTEKEVRRYLQPTGPIQYTNVTDGLTVTAKTYRCNAQGRAVKCRTKVSQAVCLIYGHI